jgi:hypothetical protein
LSNLIAHWSQAVLAIIQCRMFCCSVCYCTVHNVLLFSLLSYSTECFAVQFAVIQCRMFCCSVCYCTVHNVLLFSLLSYSSECSAVQFAIVQCRMFCCSVCYPKIYRIVILLVFVWMWGFVSHFEGQTYADGIQDWGTEEYYLRPRGTKWQGSRKEYITRSFMLWTAHQIAFGWPNKKWDRWGMWHV